MLTRDNAENYTIKTLNKQGLKNVKILNSTLKKDFRGDEFIDVIFSAEDQGRVIKNSMMTWVNENGDIYGEW